MLFNLLFLLTILFYGGFFFLNIELPFLITEVIAQIFIPLAELAMPAGIKTKEAKADI